MSLKANAVDYGSHDHAELDEQQQVGAFKRSLFAAVITGAVLCVAGYTYVHMGASVNVSSAADVSIGVAQAEAAAKRDFGVVTVETLEAEATMAKYGVRLAEAAVAAPAGVAGQGTNTFNFPVKSVNLDVAPDPKFWTVIPMTPNPNTPAVYGGDLTDPNAVHGAATPDGGVVHAGIGGSGGLYDAFAAKFTPAGVFEWGWKSSRDGVDLANAVCVLPGTGDIIIAGVAASDDGTMNRALWKLTSTGQYVWTATFGDTATSNGGFEMCEVGKDSLILTGFMGKADPGGYAFKSYGNVDCFESCKGNVMKIPLSALASGAAPSIATAGLKTRDFTGMSSGKAARELDNGDIAVVFYKSGADFDLAMVGPDLATTRWIWSQPSDTGHEGTDLTVSEDQKEIIVSGHGKGTRENRPAPAIIDGTYQGFMSSYNVVDGTKAWTKSYGAGGDPLIIYNECWGVSTVTGGYILTCGTGIECDPGTCCRTDSLKQGAMLPSGLYKLEDKCDKGLGDPRPNAVPRAPGKWNSMVIKTDKQGNLLWQRVDGTLAADGVSPATASSAAEFSVSTSKGIFVQTDLDIGFGLLYLEYQSA